MKSILKNFFRRGDPLLLGLCLAASGFGLLLIYSATRFQATYHTLPYKQGAAILLGVVVYFLCSHVDVPHLMSRWIPLFFLGSLFLLSLIPFGTGYQGNKNWLEFEWLPFNIMPAEIVKLFFILLLAKQLVWLQEREVSRITSVLQLVAHLGWFCGLIFLISGDAGSALVYGAIFLIMCWGAGLKKRWFALGGIAIAGAGWGLWQLLPADNYWIMRIRVVFDHDLDPLYRGWNQSRSLLAIRAGGISGSGYLQGILTQSTGKNALPERYTDFIFSTCGEELGLVGCAVVLALLCAIILRCFSIALHASDQLSSLAAIGFGGMLLFQTTLNVGMCLYVLPVVGITLPFFSYGGSSIVTLYAAMGFVSGIRADAPPSWLRKR